MRSLSIVSAVVFVLFIRMTAAAGQGFQGGVRGAISDQAGALIPGTVVTITNVGTNATRSTVTNDAG